LKAALYCYVQGFSKDSALMPSETKYIARVFRNRAEMIVLVFAGLVAVGVGVMTAVRGSQALDAKRRVEATTKLVQRSETGSQKEFRDEANPIKRDASSKEQQAPDSLVTSESVTSQIVSLLKSVEDISSRLRRLEEVILQDPSKALEVSLLRTQIESLKDAYRRDIDQIDSFVKWLIGLVATLAVGLLSVPVTRLIQRKYPGKTA
jgi:hypothetical protein